MTSAPRILVVGAGFVGLATAAFFAQKGLRVHVFEKNRLTLESLVTGRLHFLEPTLAEVFRSVLHKGVLTLSEPRPAEYQQSQFVIVAIDSVERNAWKMRSDSFAQIARFVGSVPARRRRTVVLKSTNVLGFSETFRSILDEQPHGDRIDLVVSPEFLREGLAYEDTANPWRVVIGADTPAAAAAYRRLLLELCGQKVPFVQVNPREAELIKLGANVYLAHRLAFVHEIADYCRAEGIDVDAVRRGIGLDPRIGERYFEPGLGFGGSCLPKDCRLINSIEGQGEFFFRTADTALAVNDQVLETAIDRLRSKLGNLKGRRIALLGATFKPDVDDTRDSQAVALALKLKRRGVNLRIWEPLLPGVQRIVAGDLALASTLNEAIEGASAVIIGVAHSRFRRMKPGELARLVRHRVIDDHFRILKRSSWEKQGWEFL